MPRLALVLALAGWLLPGAAGADPGPSVPERLIASARHQAAIPTTYDPSYRSLAYPGGDVPEGTGVCTDVLVRALRTVGHDLQQRIHEDMQAHFAQYPQLWGLSKPDPNIDHRRVPNQMTFLRRHGRALPLEEGRSPRTTYLPGDLVYWRLPGGLLHGGLVTDRKGPSGNYQVIHNLGAIGEEDCLDLWPVIGHYRYPVEARPEASSVPERP